MKASWKTTSSMVAAFGVLGLAEMGLGQTGTPRRNLADSVSAANACPTAALSTDVIVRASRRGDSPALSLCEGRSLVSSGGPGAAADPLTLAAGDFDEDGVPDLVAGYSTGKGGMITVHRGNVKALWPYGTALQNGAPAAFLPHARTFAVPEAPDFLAVGDFDADGHWDVVTAQRGSDALYFLKGDGHGGFAAAKRIPLGGSVTAMISGEVNRADGLIDLVVAVTGAQGSRALVFESPLGALKGQPEIFKLPAPATALALGKFDGGAMNDLAIASGSKIVTIHARDRKLSLGESQQATVAPAKVTVQNLPFAVEALAAGDFTGGAPSIAALGADGRVHILEHVVAEDSLAARMSRDPAFKPTMQLPGKGPDGKPITVSGSVAPSIAARNDALRRSVMGASETGTGSAEWTERSGIALPSGFAQISPRMVAGRVSGSLQEDILIPDGGNGQVHVLSTASPVEKTSSADVPAGESRRPLRPVSGPMRLLASLEAETAPATVLPMRLNQHGLSGLVLLQEGQTGPTVMPQDTPPANNFVVTNTSDAIIPVGPEITGPAGSLRKAIYDASQATGASSITFNIPTTDPGYNAATGTFLIQPLSESAPGSDNDFALGPINATVIIDGYTQPGASPNTLANGDNAKLLIQIDGGKATTPGGSGLSPFDDVGSVYRGMVFTGWINPDVSTGSGGGETASGAEGMEAAGTGDFIEGNFFGTADGKTANGNRIGVFADNGPAFGNTSGGNIIGGTTPQARNILSGNQVGGILFLSDSYQAALQGNFIGTDITGAAPLPNTDDGAGLNGPLVTIGGTLPGDGNVISGNGTNVDLNDLTNGGMAMNSIVQGNLIGTDVTGTKAVASGSGSGVSILNNPEYMTVGGTTPAARNIISGNYYGVYVFDDSFYNTVQGNYIGVDISGSNAVPNVHQGFISGVTSNAVEEPAGDTALGGAVVGAGNVISGNGADGVQITGTSNGPNQELQSLQGSTVLGNFIGTDATGKVAVPNQGNGIYLDTGATNNVIGGSDPGSGNVIAYNTGNGVLIDTGTANGQGTGNNTVGNTIVSNGGAGVRIPSGTNDLISRNSIYQNKALGIDIDVAGPNANSHCNSTNTGANNLQNAPTLTTGSGSAFITATATDPNGNTSEFSNAVKESLNGSVISLLGNFDSAPNTTYTVEFFSSPTGDPSGFGQGQTFLGSTSVTTDASCTVTVNNPVNTADADMSVTLTNNAYGSFEVGPDYGGNIYTGTVTNNGPATAHNVVFTDALPSSLTISRAYCDVGPCQTSVTTSLGACTVTANTVTCNIGTMAAGATATVKVPIEVLGTGTIVNTATVKATETDPNPANNSASVTDTSSYPTPFLDHIDPSSALVNSSDILMTVYGDFGFLANSVVSFNGTNLPTKGLLDNQVCGLGTFNQSICTGLQVVVPAAMLTTAGTPSVVVTNPGPGGGASSPATFTIAPSCTYTVDSSAIDNPVPSDGSGLIPETIMVYPNVQTCSWTASSSVPWAVPLDSYNEDDLYNPINVVNNGTTTGSGGVNYAVAPNPTASTRTGNVTVAGQTVTFNQSASEDCTTTLGSTSGSFTSTGGSGTIGITSTCFGYYVQSWVPWITIPSSSGLLSDNATASYTVAPNLGGPRTGDITVGGLVYTVSQRAPSCYFNLDTTSTTLPVAGGTGTIGVTASSPSCSWTATPSDPSLVSITSGATGTGNGAVKYSVPVNTGGPETPTITIGNSTANAVFTVNQASAFTCTFAVDPTSVQVPSNGGSHFVVVNVSFEFCQWTATSSDPTLLAITSTQSEVTAALGSGTGTGTIQYSVAQNTGGPRTLTLTVGCRTFTINQAGAQTTNNPVPAITTLSPSSTTAGSAAFTLTVNGSGFINGSVVNFNGHARTTTFVSATQVTAAIPASDVATAGTVPVTVTNPTPGGGTSNSVNFTITAANNPVPAITTLSPSSTTAGSAAFTLTVNGTGFINGSMVNFNGHARTTTFVSATQVTAAIPASDVATAGTVPVTVTNPTPGGGTSNSVNFTITAANNPVPAITTLSPSSTTAGSAAFTLTVNGSGFINGSVVNFNGHARTTTFVSGTQVTAAIPASDVATAGTVPVTVTNPTPGGGTSNSVNFTITAANNPVPAITTLVPSSTTAGSAAFTLTVNGSGFIPGSVVNFNGHARTTTFVSGTQVTAAIPASDVATAGTVPVTVTNPTPGGGTSNSVNFTITAANNPVPAITTLSPSSTTAGSAAFTLTVNGTGFINGSMVNFNGHARTTTFVSATQVTAAIPASDVATAGTVPVTVTNPTPGGGTSNSVNFTITAVNNPVPAITMLSPSSTAAGSAAFTLTVNGSGFIPGSVVNFNGHARTTTFVSGTQVTAAIPASDVGTAGTAPVTVTNPTPGGGTSNSVNFTITAANNPVPAITTLVPSSTAVGSAAFTLTVNGSGFIPGSVVNFNGHARTTTFVSGTQVTAAIPASDVATAGTASVTVTNPPTGGGTSNSVNFTITPASNPLPALTTLQPSSGKAGSGAFTLTVNGSGFISGSVVNFAGSARATTYVSATQLTAAILATDIATAGLAAVTVTNPAPGGGTSNALTFTITAPNNPVPAITTLQPSTAVAGSGAFTLTVNGSGFITGSVVNFAGSARTTTFVSATQLTAAILATDIVMAGTASVTVINPSPGGGTSNAVTFSITAPSAPTGSLTPTTVAFANTVTGATSSAQTITLSNGGNAALVITSITIGGTNPTDFAETNTCGTSLAAGANCSISVTFTPASAAAYTATLSVADNAPGSPQTATLSGTGTVAPSFTISSSTTAQTIQPGGSAQYSVIATAQNGTFANPITLSATGIPTGAIATFAPMTITPGITSATSMLTIQTAAAATAVAASRGSGWPLAASLVPLLGLLFAPRRFRRRWIAMVVVMFTSLGALAALTGCGGGFSLTNKLTPQTYSIAITGTSGDEQQSTTVQLTVQ